MDVAMLPVGPLLGSNQIGYIIGQIPSDVVPNRVGLLRQLREIADPIGGIIGVTHIAIGKVATEEESPSKPSIRIYFSQFHVTIPADSELNGEGEKLRAVLEKASQNAQKT